MAKFKRKEEQHTSEGLPLVSIDLGSSSVKLLAAEETDPTCPGASQLRILASEEATRYRCMKKGLIQNTTEASYMIRESLLLLGNRLNIPQDQQLPTAFTLLGGKTMRVTQVKVRRNQGFSGPLRQTMLDEMRNEAIYKAEIGRSSQPIVGLDARPACYEFDENEPLAADLTEVGRNFTQVQATYSTFYGTPDLKQRVSDSFDRAGKSIEHAFARPSALIEALASEKDEAVGVAIIDMGADTTTVSIYKTGRFLSCKVAPLGGNNITMDIQQLGISAADAEKLKLRFGNAAERPGDQKTIRCRNVREGEEDILVKTNFLSTIIVSRLEEILLPVFAELKQYEEQIGQVYLTGGASKMAGMVEYVQSHTSLPVDYGSHADWLSEDTAPQYFAPEYSAAVGALLLGAKYRRDHQGQPLPGTKIPQGGRKGIVKSFTDLFTQHN